MSLYQDQGHGTKPYFSFFFGAELSLDSCETQQLRNLLCGSWLQLSSQSFSALNVGYWILQITVIIMSNIEDYISLIAKLWNLTFYAAGHSTNKKCPIRQPYTSTKMSSSKKWHFTLNTKLQIYGVCKLGLTLTNFCWYMLLSTKPVHERFDLYIIVIQPLSTNMEKKSTTTTLTKSFILTAPAFFIS